MGLMERHIAIQILRYIFIVTVCFGFLVILIQSLQLLRLVINNGIDVVTFGYLLILALPRLLSYALPLSVFIAIIWVFWRLRDDNETVILRSAGVSDWALLKAPLAVSFAMSLLLYIFLLYVNPLARENFVRLQLSAKSEFVLSLIQPGRFNALGNDVTLYIGEMDERFRMREIFLYDGRADEDLGSSGQTIIAAEGQLFQGDDGLRLVVRDGSQQVIRNGRLHNLSFDEYVISLSGGLSGSENRLFSRWRKASERSSLDLFRLLFLSSGGEQSLSVRSALWGEFHDRLVYPLLAPLLGLWGCYVMLGWGERFRRRGGIFLLPVFHPIVLGFVGSILLYFIYVLLVNRVKQVWELWFLLYLFFIFGSGILLFLIRFSSVQSLRCNLLRHFSQSRISHYR